MRLIKSSGIFWLTQAFEKLHALRPQGSVCVYIIYIFMKMWIYVGIMFILYIRYKLINYI